MPDIGTVKPDLAQATANLESALQEFRSALPPRPLRGPETPVFAALRIWRTEQARAKGLPPYIIATDAALRAIDAARPADLAQLGAVRGVGANKAATYGAEILEVVARAEVPIYSGPPEM